jgi:hypothetical protein
MDVSGIVTLVVAIIGATTGIIGTGLAVLSIYRQIDDDRVKLRVGVYFGMVAGPVPPFLMISVTNVSKFPITLRETGLLIDGGKRRSIHPDAMLNNGNRLPIRMEPRTSVSVNYPPDFLTSAENQTAYCAYASTDCGETVQSAPDVVPQMIKEAHQNAKEA